MYLKSDNSIVVGFVDGVLTVTINRPERKNSFTDSMVTELAQLIEDAGGRAEVRVVHITATGSHFCSGFDLSERASGMKKPTVGSIQRRMDSHVNRLIRSMRNVQKPIVVTARGWVIGLGLGILLAADFAVVDNEATLWAPFTGLGFTPDSGTSWLLTERVGDARARRLLLLSEKISGQCASDWGMVHEASQSEDLDNVSRKLVDQLATSATIAIGQTKLLVHRSSTSSLEEHLSAEGWAMEVSSRSSDFKENVAARRDKRSPNFTGE